MLATHNARCSGHAALGAVFLCPSTAAADPYHAEAPVALIIARSSSRGPSGGELAHSALRCAAETRAIPPAFPRIPVSFRGGAERARKHRLGRWPRLRQTNPAP
jgi:hypothetical protein